MNPHSADRTIEIVVLPDGRTRVETRGFRGSACRDASRFLEEALGRRTGEMVTAEFHESATGHQQLRQQP
jgi:hypothetical protein